MTQYPRSFSLTSQVAVRHMQFVGIVPCRWEKFDMQLIHSLSISDKRWSMRSSTNLLLLIDIDEFGNARRAVEVFDEVKERRLFAVVHNLRVH